MTTATKAPAATNAVKTPTGPGEATKTLAGLYSKGLTVQKDGNAAAKDGSIEGLIEANLPEDVTLASIKRHQKVRDEVLAALGGALWETGQQTLVKNKDLDRVVLAAKFGNDKIDLAIDREREFNDGKGGKLKKHGYMSVGYTARGATNSGEFKKMREQISSEAVELFGK